MQLQLRLFGPPAIVRQSHIDPIRLKRCALLLALLAADRHGVDKDALAERLWAEGDITQRKRRLRRLVFEARAQLGETALIEEGGRLRLEAEWLANCDLATWFNCHSRQLYGGEAGDSQASLRMVEQARLPLLGDLKFDENCAAVEWLEYQRVAQAGIRRRMRAQLVLHYLDSGDERAALTLLLQDLPTDPLDESGWEQAATLLHRGGRFTECVVLFQTLRRQLAQELGLEVAPSFHRLAADASARLAAASVWGAARPKTRYVDSGDAHIAYQVFGAGKQDLILIPGFVSNVEIFWELPQLASFFAELAPHFRIILFDRRGVGLSDRGLENSADHHAVHDILAVLGAAQCSQALVFAASEGGPLGIRLATEHPARVSGLCLYGTLAKGCAEDGYTAALTRDQYTLWLESLVASWGTPAALRVFCPSHAEDPVLRDWWSRLLRQSSSPAAVARILEQLREVDVRPLLGLLAGPVTLIHRNGDLAVRIEAARYMAARISGARLVELEGKDHFWWMSDTGPLLAELQRLKAPLLHVSI
jgi:pimeloyl-ACP methyl ester carboxylesterase/DNA-binding SARP family transcriptional activator